MEGRSKPTYFLMARDLSHTRESALKSNFSSCT